MNEIERSGGELDLNLLRGFLAIAREGNVTKAAGGIGRTQSALSVQLKRLEALLGVSLFEREARGMRLTDAGLSLLPRAESLLREARALRDAFSGELSGQVTIAIPDDCGPSVLAGILQRFCAAYPEVEVFARCGFSAAFAEAVDAGTVDLAVYAAPGELAGGERLADVQIEWVARQDWSPPPPGEAILLALFDRECWWRDVAIRSLASAGILFRTLLSSESVLGLKAAVSAGLAVAPLARESLDPGMRILSQAEGFPRLPASCLTLLRRAGCESEAVARMAEAIRLGFRQP